MSFDRFQTDQATLQKIDTNYAGDESVLAEYDVNIDPSFGWKRIYTDENEEITGRSTIITSDTLDSDWDESHEEWNISYRNEDWQIREANLMHDIGTNNLSHIEVVLT